MWFSQPVVLVLYEGGYLRNPLKGGFLKLNFSIEKPDFLARAIFLNQDFVYKNKYFFMKVFLNEPAWSLLSKTSKNINIRSVEKIWRPVEFKNPPQRVCQITLFIYKGFTNLGPLEVSVRDLVRKKSNFLFFVYLYSSHAVLSMIFGIFGKFGIEICDPFCLSKNVSSKCF